MRLNKVTISPSVFFLGVACLLLISDLTASTALGQEPKGIATLQGHVGLSRVIAFSHDGKSVAAGSADGVIRMWDVASGKERMVFRAFSPPLTALAFSPDGKTLASGHSDSAVNLWDVASGQTIARVGGHRKPVSAVVFRPDGRVLASASEDETVIFWNIGAGKTTLTLPGRTSSPLFAIAFSPDGRTFSSASYDGNIGLLELATIKERAVLKGYNKGYLVAFSPDGRLIASAGRQSMKLWDLLSRQELATLKGEYPVTQNADHNVSTVAFSPDNKTLLCKRRNGSIEVWDIVAVTKLPWNQSLSADGVAFGPGGEVLALSTGDRKIRVWTNPITTLEMEARNLITTLGKANKDGSRQVAMRLSEIGVVALGPLGEAAERGNAETRHAANALIEVIRSANSRPTTLKSTPKVVAGMEFTVIADKEWLVPTPGRAIEINIRLDVRNTTDTVYRLHLLGNTSLVLKDKTGKEFGERGSKRSERALSPFSPPLAKDQKAALFFDGTLTCSEEQLTFVCKDPFLNTWVCSGLSKGTYQLILVYQNTKQDSESSAPLWVGRTEILIETVHLK